MDLFDLPGFLFLAMIGWLWYDSLNVRETAVAAVKAGCHSESLLLLDDVKPGDFVMLHAGFAIEKIDAEEAAETLRLLNEIANNSPQRP